MQLYLDTSALVKLYIVEPNADIVYRAVSEATLVCSSAIGYVETRSALARRLREGWLDEVGHARAVAELDINWVGVRRRNVTDSLAMQAGAIAQAYGLRGYDAVHLASALDFQRRNGEITFLGFDDRLNDAAVQAGLTLYGEESAPTT